MVNGAEIWLSNALKRFQNLLIVKRKSPTLKSSLLSSEVEKKEARVSTIRFVKNLVLNNEIVLTVSSNT